jgi:hypothetical protein
MHSIRIVAHLLLHLITTKIEMYRKRKGVGYKNHPQYYFSDEYLVINA